MVSPAGSSPRPPSSPRTARAELRRIERKDRAAVLLGALVRRLQGRQHDGRSGHPTTLFIYSLGPLQIVLMCEASPVDGGALAALEHDLEEPYACMNEQRPTRHVRDLELLVV